MSKQHVVNEARKLGVEVKIVRQGKHAMVVAESEKQLKELESIGFTMNEITWHGSVMVDRLENGQPAEILS